MRALDRKVLRDVARWRGQMAAIALILACGIAAFATMVSLYESLDASLASYYRAYHFADVFGEAKRAPESVAVRIAALPGVHTVVTRLVYDVTLDLPGRTDPVSGRLVSLPEGRQPALNALYVRSGRLPEAGKRGEAVVSEAFAKANRLRVGDRIGAAINGRWERVRIVGIGLSPEFIYEIRGVGDIFPDDRRFGVLWMGRRELASAFDMTGAFDSLALSLAPGAREADVIAGVDRILAPYGGIGAYGRDEQISDRFLSNELEELRTSAVLTPVIFLAVAAFLLHVLMLRLVQTQRAQIAVLKAFGYSNAAIGWHYLKFAGLCVAAGSVVGIAAAYWFGFQLAAYYTVFFHFPVLRYVMSPRVLAGSAAVGAVAAAAGALLAVSRAVSLPPAEAMRPAAPPQFRPTVLERLGFQRLFSPGARMIVRNLERKPAQAILSCLGIALAFAMLVTGRYAGDAVRDLIDLQFHTVDRSDATVVFRQPLPLGARFDLMHLPGVLREEPFRAVPVRLSAGHRSRRVALQGIPLDGTLRRLVGRDGRLARIPAGGLLLTERLAHILEVVPGGAVRVDFQEGHRRVRTVRVAAVVDEAIGLNAYMGLSELNRLAADGQTFSGAYLDVDPLAAARLDARLKTTPAIAGVSFRAAAMANVERTLAQTLRVTTITFVVFACIIAFGVVYNAGRIALSERSGELSVLRIIGFTRAQVATVLLGEEAILTLLAMPIGAALGYGLAAVVSLGHETDLFRLPLTVSPETYAFAVLVVAAAAVASASIVRAHLDHLDLIGVLKTGE